MSGMILKKGVGSGLLAIDWELICLILRTRVKALYIEDLDKGQTEQFMQKGKAVEWHFCILTD